MTIAGMTSAVLLVGAPINMGGLSLALPAEQIGKAETEQSAPQSTSSAQGVPRPAPAPPVPTADPKAAPLDPPQAATPASTDPELMEMTVTARTKTPGDPLERANALSFEVTQAVDRAVVGPAALTFAKIVPLPVREGFGNFLFNLQEPKVFVNFVLQHKIGKAAETVARFLINSTIGVGGLFDIAKRKPFKLPRRPNGLANTLGFYGVKPGAYLFLPIVGPTTIRDIVGSSIDQLLLPLAVGRPFNRPEFTLPITIGRTLDRRAYFDDELRKMREGPKDLYSARRDLYLQMRQDEIDDLKGRPHTPIRPTLAPVLPAKATEPAPAQLPPPEAKPAPTPTPPNAEPSPLIPPPAPATTDPG
jgi:phospholipid-binding lipoprotein MlaA